MNSFDELASHFNNLDESKKEIILSLLSDFVFYEKKLNELRDVPQYLINPKNPLQQKKLPIHDVIKNFQAQKNDIAVKILRTLQDDIQEESALTKALEAFK